MRVRRDNSVLSKNDLKFRLHGNISVKFGATFYMVANFLNFYRNIDDFHQVTQTITVTHIKVS